MLAELGRLAAQTREHALDGLSARERTQLEALLQRVKNNLSANAAADAAGDE